MGFSYESPPEGGPLRQGEILGPLWDHQPLVPPTELPEGEAIDFSSVRHPLMIVITQDCDLLWDFEARFETEEAKKRYEPEAPEIENHRNCLARVLLCDVFEHDELRGRISGSDVWRRIRQNQDERYHRLETASVGASEPNQEAEGSSSGATLPDLYLDFKKALALSTRQLYVGLRGDDVERRGVVPPIFLHDLVHRFFGYLSRVALPIP